MNFLTLILSLPTENANARMRAWRALKAAGAAVLRDGVYLMPDREACQATLKAVAADVDAGGGNAYVMRAEILGSIDPDKLFDRTEDYAGLLTEISRVQQNLSQANLQDAIKQARRLRKSFATVSEIDFFPGEAQKQVDAAIVELELACARALAPDEPHAADSEITRWHIASAQGRIWATRCRPWVDRLACAWLIRRFIDAHAPILWLTRPADCPPDALGFDFDGATFTHVGNRVSYEVILASFAFDQPELVRLGQLVHYLDVGGVQPPEAAGVESVLSGLRAAIQDDDLLLQAAGAIFDGLLLTFQRDAEQNKTEKSI